MKKFFFKTKLALMNNITKKNIFILLTIFVILILSLFSQNYFNNSNDKKINNSSNIYKINPFN